jgi:hypothetical protein
LSSTTWGALDGDGTDANAAEAVAAEIVAAGGEAIANTDNVTDWQTGENLVKARRRGVRGTKWSQS